METRLLIAYGLIAAVALAVSVAFVVSSRRRAARRRRMRGIKVEQVMGAQRR